MELGETLTITAVITSNTFLATRSRDNSEVTIRISPSSGSPTIPKRNTPKTPPPSLSIIATKPPMPAKLDLEPQTLHDRVMMQGWAMVATQQPQVAWDIAWVCTTTLPIPKISIMLESELNIKPTVPSKFEEIESIAEVESLPGVNGTDRAEPLKFDIRTKTGKTYKIITNNFMTIGLRRLMTNITHSVYPFKKIFSVNSLDSPQTRWYKLTYT
jgi:hypothetical protein